MLMSLLYAHTASAQANAGSLEAIQGQAQAAAASSGSGQLALTTLTGQDARSTETDRAHLEANMASALVLQSPQEYRRWLLTYVRHLTQSEPHVTSRPCATVTPWVMFILSSIQST